MEFIKPGININFIGHRKIAVIISLVLIGIALISLIIQGGPKYGVDFAGGTLVQVKFEKQTGITEVRKAIVAQGKGQAVVQKFGLQGSNEYLIKLQETTTSLEGIEDQIKR